MKTLIFDISNLSLTWAYRVALMFEFAGWTLALKRLPRKIKLVARKNE